MKNVTDEKQSITIHAAQHRFVITTSMPLGVWAELLSAFSEKTRAEVDRQYAQTIEAPNQDYLDECLRLEPSAEEVIADNFSSYLF